MCAIKRRLPSYPPPNGHLARRDRGLLLSGEEIGRWSLLPSPPLSFSLTLRPRMRHLAGVFFRPSDVPQETTTSTRAFRFSDGFFDKAPETTGRSAVGSTTITIDWRTLASIASIVRRKGWRRRLRGKIAFLGLYRHAGGRTVSEARSISTATMVRRGYSCDAPDTGEDGERGWKKGRMSGRSEENRGRECKKPGKLKRAALAR